MDVPTRGRGLVAALLPLLLVLVACGASADPSTDPRAEPRQASRERTPAVTPSEPPAREPSARATPARPNLLVIETDDMRADELRWMPQVRRLVQRRGLTFENSFSPYPLCCPARASFLTGRYAHNHHVYSHLDPYGFASFDDRRTLATSLQRAGYRTALVGKYLNGYGQQAVRSTGESSLGYVPPGWTRWMAGSDHWWGPADAFSGGTYDYFHLTQNVDGRIRSHPGRYSTDVLAEQTRGLTSRWGAGRRPWFVWWTPVAPHHGQPREADDPPPSRRSDGGTTTWVTPARPDWVKGRFDREIRHGLGVRARGSSEADNRDKPRYLRKQSELTDAERDALTRVSRQRAEALYALDVQIGRTLGQLRRSGQLARTIVVFTSDNGYYLGEHRKRQGKINAHEPSLRVPLLVAGPGVPQGRRFDPVSTIDLAPTLAGWAGTAVPRPDGVDLRPLVRRGDRGWTRPVVTEGMMPEGRYAERHRLGPSPLNSRGLRLGRWKITRYSTGETEVYDLATDPLELDNLSRRPRYADEVARLRTLLERYQDCRGAACAAAVPPRWRTSAAETRRITEAQARATRAYFR